MSFPILLRLYSTDKGGRGSAILPGFRAIACLDRNDLGRGYSAFFDLSGPLNPGEAVCCGVDFLTPESEQIVLAAKRFYLMEGPKLTGEAHFI